MKSTFDKNEKEVLKEILLFASAKTDEVIKKYYFDPKLIPEYKNNLKRIIEIRSIIHHWCGKPDSCQSIVEKLSKRIIELDKIESNRPADVLEFKHRKGYDNEKREQQMDPKS